MRTCLKLTAKIATFDARNDCVSVTLDGEPCILHPPVLLVIYYLSAQPSARTDSGFGESEALVAHGRCSHTFCDEMASLWNSQNASLVVCKDGQLRGSFERRFNVYLNRRAFHNASSTGIIEWVRSRSLMAG